METTKMKTLLNSTARIVKHYKQLTEARGEYYNMFSVLKIETRENNTHSAFLADLLNPKGAHRQGAIFLDLFGDVLNGVDGKNKKSFEYSKRTQVRPEKGIGDINIKKQTGGRIDIFLKDVKGNTISIENKIHAPEQKFQVARYCNYQTDTNTVYYLTLNGEKPSKYSRGDKKEGSDFYLLSYKEDISNWLQLCLKEVPNFTALRETINQYILLIKKLTFTMNNEQQKELSDIMLENMEESKYIAENYERLTGRLRDKFRKTLKHELAKSLDNIMYSVDLGDDIHSKFSQIWITHKSTIKCQKDVLFGVESFTGRGHHDGNMFVGIYNDDKSKIGDKLEDKNVINKWWRQTESIVSEDNNPVNLANFYWLKVISKPESKEYKELLDNSKKVILNFVKSFEGVLPK